MRLPLTITAASGAVYRLENASFVVRSVGGDVVATLDTNADPDAEKLTLELDAGSYTVELEEGWTLRRTLDGNSSIVVAELVSPRVVPITITENAESLVIYRFVTNGEDVDLGEGTLGIGIAVEESPTCVVGPEHTCPIHVDPSAATSGDGSSWESPLVSIDAAVQLQFDRGGGQVWVRGPGPFASLTADPLAPLIELRYGVTLIGGFAGTELYLEDREPGAQTELVGAERGDLPSVAPLVVGAPSSSFEGFRITGHSGTALLFYGAEDFRVADVTLEGNSHFDSHLVDVVGSTGTFDAFRVVDSSGFEGVTGIRADQSSIVVTSSEFSGLFSLDNSVGIFAEQSTLALGGVWFTDNGVSGIARTPGLFMSASSAFVADSVWLRTSGDGSTVQASDSLFVAVNSHWEGSSSVGPTLLFLGTSTVDLVNSSFVGNRAEFGSAVSALAGTLRVVNSTFYDNRNSFDPYPYDIQAGDEAEFQLVNSFSDSGERAVSGAYTGSGNCIRDAEVEASVDTSAGYSRVFLGSSSGCADIGDDAGAASAALRVRNISSSSGLPFEMEDDWWQPLTSLYDVCTDAPPVDAGRHYESPFCDEP